MSEHDPYYFGAQGGGVVDDSIPLQDWINWHQNHDHECEWPKDTFYSSAALLQTGFLKWNGAGRGQSVLRGPGLKALVTNAGERRFWDWEEFSIVPVGAMAGGLRLIVVEPGAFLSNWNIRNMEIGQFSGPGVSLDNTIHNGDGLFTGNIERCWIEGGIWGMYTGDSNTIQGCTITGDGIGIALTGTSGARQTVIERNNITTSGGALALISVDQAQVGYNQMEHPGYRIGYTGPYDAFCYFASCFMPMLMRNTINPNNVPEGETFAIPSSAVTFDGTTLGAELQGNDINKGSMFHLNVGGGVGPVLLRKYNHTYGGIAWANSGSVLVEV